MISVIMPVFNAQRYIKKAVDSILNQTEQDIELILIDDCGQDASMDIVCAIKDPRIKFLKNDKNRGIAFSRNRGLEAAGGEYIALMDDDDIAPPERLKIEKKFLDSNPEIEVVGGRMASINEIDEMISYARAPICNPKRIWAELMFRDVIANGSAMMRTSFIRKNNLKYRDNYLGMEDYKFWTECSIAGQLANIDEILLLWRKTENNETHRVRQEKEEERKKLFAQIQNDTLTANGFILSEEEYHIFNQSFRERKKEYITLDNLRKTQCVLKKLIEQAKERHTDRTAEFEFVCHRMLALKTENSEIWYEPSLGEM